MVGLTGVVQISLGGNHTLAVKSDGTVWACGSNLYGQLGDGTNINHSTPFQVAGLTNIVQVAAGSYHSLALKSNGTVWAWGYNNDGELGNGTDVNSLVPVQASGFTGGVKIAAGGGHSLAVKSDGTVWTWGDNLAGQLGDGTIIKRKQPTLIAGIDHAVQVAGGNTHSLVLKSDGTVLAFGSGSLGQLGDGTYETRLSPVGVLGVSNIIQIATGQSHSLALKWDGTVWAWGSNGHGELGDGTQTTSNAPIATALSGVLQVAGGSQHSLALKSDLSVWGWGANNYGQLGDGSNSMALLPVQTAGLSGQTMIAAGEFHSSSVIAVKTATTTTPKNLSFVYGKPVVLSAVIKSSLSVALAQKAIDFSLDGIHVGTGISDASGKAIVTVGNPLAFLGGSHAIVASFAGDILLLPSQGNATLTVTPSDTTLTAGNVTGRVGDTKTLIATLKRNSNNKPMINKTVYFKSAGTLLGTAMTDGFGKATLMYAIGESFGVGVFLANAGYDGDASHNASSASFTLTINQSPTLLSQLNLTGQRGATVVLTATLKRTTDNAGVAGRTVRFEVQGKAKGQATTDANGVATLNYLIPASFSYGAHKMSVKFDGDALYVKNSNINGILTVNP